MALIEKVGYGQVEPNHLSAQRTGQIYAQLSADSAIEVLENGAFLKMDAAAGEANATGDGEWRLVYNEIKLYDPARETYKDFAVRANEAIGGIITPRLFKINEGDIFTTNLAEDAAVGDKLSPVATDNIGVLKPTAANAGEMEFVVMKKTTMPDGQPAIKVMAQIKANDELGA